MVNTYDISADDGTGSEHGMRKTRMIVMLVMSVMLMVGMLCSAGQQGYGIANASVTVGGTEMNGYTPSDMVSTDGGVSSEKLAKLPSKVETAVIAFIKLLLPFLAIGAVVVIVYNSIANWFRKDEDKVPIGGLLKEIIKSFFFIFFAWIIVEVIIYVILGGEVFLEEYLLS